jgi:acetolactate synthase-1/2/3 large subunit
VDFATNFKEVNYIKIAEGFGLKASKVSRSSDLSDVLINSFNDPEPSFTEVVMKPEDKLIPPVPKWIRLAREKDIDYIG